MIRSPMLFVALFAAVGVAGACGGGSSASLPTDEAAPAPTPPLLTWSRQAGLTGDCWGTDAARWPDDSMVVVGGFDGQALFDAARPAETTLTATGPSDIFVARYDLAGTLVWVEGIFGNDISDVRGVAVSSDGAVSVVGWFFDRLTFDDGGPGEQTLVTSAPGDDDGFVAHYAQDGTFLWVRQIASSFIDEALSVAARPDASVVVGGAYSNPMTLGSGANEVTLTPTGDIEGFLAAYAPDGTLLWATSTQSDPGSVLTVWALGVWPDGSVAATGEYEGVSAIGTQGLSSVGGSADVWLARFDPDGVPSWARSLGGPSTDQAFGLGVAPDGGIRIAGDFFGEALFGFVGGNPVSLTSAGVADGFVASYGPLGALEWARRIGGVGSDYVYDAYVDDTGAMQVVGFFQDEAVFGAGEVGETTLQSSGAGDREAFLAGYTSDGLLGWVYRIGGPGDDFGVGIQSLSGGAVLVTGSFEGTATFSDFLSADATLTARGDRDAFFALFAP